MAKRTPISERPDLIRKPDEWARDWGWISRRRAVNLARKITDIADAIEGALDDDGAQVWTNELRAISKNLAPAEVPAEKKRAKRERVAAMREL